MYQKWPSSGHSKGNIEKKINILRRKIRLLQDNMMEYFEA